MSYRKKSFRKFGKETSFRKTKPQTKEDKIKDFIMYNTKNGYYTKVSTLSRKFGISAEQTWDIVGALLAEDVIESIHDEKSEEMKLCESGKKYHILNLRTRKKKTKEQKLLKNIESKSKVIINKWFFLHVKAVNNEKSYIFSIDY